MDNDTNNAPQTPSTKPSTNYAIPIAIVVAGLLIAGAVILTDRGNLGSQNQEAERETSLTKLPEIAKEIGVDKSKFNACVDSAKYKDKVAKSLEEGIQAKVTGTPASFIVSKNRAYMVSGALDPQSFKAIIDQVLTGKTPDASVAKPVTYQIRKVDATDHIIGSVDAEVVVVEYSDLQCPYCKAFHDSMHEVISQYSKDKIAWVYRHFPLSQIHQYAEPAAEASECVNELGGNEKFWQFIDAVFAGQ